MAKGTPSVQRPTVTLLSRFRVRLGLATAQLRALVRSSQFVTTVVISGLLDGCLFPEPPVWDSKPTPPLLMDFIPQTSEMVVIQANSVAQTFNLSELSEDEGHLLRAVWYLNYGLPNETYLNSRDYPAGHLNQLKDISVSWTPTQKMCASFTLMVTHAENDNRQNNHHPIDPSDAAFVTWWVNVYDSTSGGPSIADCLTSAGASP